MNIQIASGLRFTFSILSPDPRIAKQPHMEAFDAPNLEAAWKKIGNHVKDLCLLGKLGTDVDPQRVKITLVNTAAPQSKP